MEPLNKPDPRALYDAKRLLREQLATIELHWRREADPIIRQLANLEMLTPQPPRVMAAHLLDPAMLAHLRPLEPGMESFADRTNRLERERNQLLHLLRLIKGAVPGSAMPAFLVGQIADALENIIE